MKLAVLASEGRGIGLWAYERVGHVHNEEDAALDPRELDLLFPVRAPPAQRRQPKKGGLAHAPMLGRQFRMARVYAQLPGHGLNRHDIRIVTGPDGRAIG